MTQKRSCKICGEYSGKRKVCLGCKTRFPYKASPKGFMPFNRLWLQYMEGKKR